MVLEFFEGVFTSCPQHVRVMGYLDEIIAIGARQRRCTKDWQPHLEKTKDVIRQAISLCEPRRKAVIFGSGRLHDVPLGDLAATFQRIVLVDMIHPNSARKEAQRFQNVEFQSVDVTAVAERVFHLGPVGGLLPVSAPSLFLDDPDVDLVVSVNLLSQLPYSPCKYLRRWDKFSASQLNDFARHLIGAHLAYLHRFTCTVCLIADEAYLTYDAQDQLVEERNALHGVNLPWPGETWTWRLAPRGEQDSKTSLFHRVRGTIRRRTEIVPFA